MAKVLIIESDAQVARELADALSKKGIDSKITADGTEGLALARSERPKLIVLCVELSRVSGYSICNKLKKDPELGQIPLILTSSQATEETFEQHKKLKTRAEAYLKKPYSDAEMMGLVGQYLGGGRAPDVEVSLDEVSVEVDDPPAPRRQSPVATSSTDDLDLEALGLETSPKKAAVDRTAVDRTAVRPAASGAASNDEVRQLRQKIQKLEQALEQKDLEFNDRLLEESSRSREAVEAKKKLQVVERDIDKYKQLADKAKQDAEQARSELKELREQSQGGDAERQNLSDKIGQLVDKVKSLAAERDGLNKQVAELKEREIELQQKADEAAKVREKAKKAIDIAAQLIEETGLLQ